MVRYLGGGHQVIREAETARRRSCGGVLARPPSQQPSLPHRKVQVGERGAWPPQVCKGVVDLPPLLLQPHALQLQAD
jgi:hypothetical protein